MADVSVILPCEGGEKGIRACIGRNCFDKCLFEEKMCGIVVGGR